MHIKWMLCFWSHQWRKRAHYPIKQIVNRCTIYSYYRIYSSILCSCFKSVGQQQTITCTLYIVFFPNEMNHSDATARTYEYVTDRISWISVIKFEGLPKRVRLNRLGPQPANYYDQISHTKRLHRLTHKSHTLISFIPN